VVNLCGELAVMALEYTPAAPVAAAPVYTAPVAAVAAAVKGYTPLIMPWR
jgi:hypothetical protein